MSGKAVTNHKRRRDQSELDAQAQLFGVDWRAGDRVMTWLRRHEGQFNELSLLVRDGWSWADIGQAMHIAGIAYQTGAPITDDILRKKANEARSAPLTPRPQSMPQVAPTIERAETFEFRPASLSRHQGKKAAEAIVLPQQTLKAPPAPPIDVDEVLARFTGRK